MKFDEGCEVYLEGQKVKNLLILLHGYGSNGSDMMRIGYFICENLNDYAFIAPNGFEGVFGLDDGYKWFDIPEINEEIIYECMVKNKDKFLAYIDFQVQRFGVSYENLILCGFSQGACAAIYTSLIMDKKIKAVVSLSGGLPCASKIAKDIKCSQKIFLIHGQEDEVLDCNYSVKAFNELKNSNPDIHLDTIQGLGHSINAEVLNKVKHIMNQL